MKALKILAGVLMMLTALWGGAYALHLQGGTWMAFPLFASSSMLGLGGYFVMFWGIAFTK